MWSRLKAVAMLYILLSITLPISLFAMGAAIFWHILFYKDFLSQRIPPGWRGTALVSGTLYKQACEFGQLNLSEIYNF